MRNPRGILIVVSGFSGAGKGTIVKKLLSEDPSYSLSISATTRAPRPGEEDGREYFFVTRERFEEMIRAGELYEYTTYQDNYYGTPRSFVDSRMEEGRDVVLEIDVDGAGNIKKRFPGTVTVFVTPPGMRVLRERLTGRGTETPEKIEGRLRRAAEEADRMADYDYILINDDLDTAVSDLRALIRAEHMRTSRSGELMERMSAELKQTTV